MSTRVYTITAIVGVLLLALGLYASRDIFTPEAPPAETSEPLLTYTDEHVTFEYPETLSTTYIRAIDWPPKVTVTDSAISCEAGETEIGMTKQIDINGRTYCVTTRSEGAAGSMYTDYTYVTEKDGKTLTLTFTLRLVQCANYNEPDRSLCTAEREGFSVDDVAARVLQSAEVK